VVGMKQAIRQVLLFDLLSEVGGNGSPGAILVATGRMLGKPNSAAIPPLQHGPSQALACELGSSVRAASTRAGIPGSNSISGHKAFFLAVIGR
jgi:hypothetical protein